MGFTPDSKKKDVRKDVLDGDDKKQFHSRKPGFKKLIYYLWIA